MNNNYPAAPENFSLTAEYIRKLKDSINFAIRGKSNNTGELTLTASATSTVINDNNCNANSVVLIIPGTANAAANASGIYIVASDKSFTVTHTSTVHTDKKFRYVIIG